MFGRLITDESIQVHVSNMTAEFFRILRSGRFGYRIARKRLKLVPHNVRIFAPDAKLKIPSPSVIEHKVFNLY